MTQEKKKVASERNPGRVLLIFIGIGLVFVVQMAWWVIFFIRSVTDDVRERYLGMLISEGVFFIVLILLGLYQIYRVLKHQMFLKQQFRDFFAGFSHELKTPLASMKLQLETQLSIDLPENKRKELNENMLEDVERLELSLENILDVFRYESGELRMVPQPVDIDGWLRHTADSFVRSYHAESLKVHYDLASQAMVAIDDRYFHTVVANLVQNSFRYSEVSPVLYISSCRQGDEVLLRFRDEGVGLEADEIEKVFRKFYRADQDHSLKHKGVGIGLFLCRQIVEAHQGEIAVSSEGKNKGAIFTIKLKVRDDECG